jgi:pseudouridine kinase
MGRFICIGGAVVDRKYFAEQPVVPGSSTPARSVSGPGGVARNVAETLSRLGQDVALVSRVGADDAGRRLVRELVEAGVDASGVEAFAGERTAEYVAFLSPDGDMVCAMADMAILDGIGTADIGRWSGRIRDADMVFAETNLDSGTLEELLAATRSSGVRLAVDAISVAKAARLPASLAGISCLFLNMQEAPAVLGISGSDADDPAHLAKALIRRGAASVVLTLGGRGAIAHDGTNAHLLPAENVTVVEVTGAGDALAAGTILALVEGRPLVEAVSFGIHLAGLALSVPESVPPGLSPDLPATFFARRGA